MTDAKPVDSAFEELTQDQKCGHYIELWKQTVGVQQHFNDLEWRIRGLALTAATFALGAAAVAAKDSGRLGAIVLIAGLFLWYSFYFVDKYWYHPLLLGAVKQGDRLEGKLHSILPEYSGLTKEISKESAISPPFPFCFMAKKDDGKLHSDQKLFIFYAIGGLILAVMASVLWFCKFPASSDSKPKVERVIEIVKPTETPAPTTVTVTVSVPTTSATSAPSVPDAPTTTVGTSTKTAPK